MRGGRQQPEVVTVYCPQGSRQFGGKKGIWSETSVPQNTIHSLTHTHTHFSALCLISFRSHLIVTLQCSGIRVSSRLQRNNYLPIKTHWTKRKQHFSFHQHIIFCHWVCHLEGHRASVHLPSSKDTSYLVWDPWKREDPTPFSLQHLIWHYELLSPWNKAVFTDKKHLYQCPLAPNRLRSFPRNFHMAPFTSLFLSV